MTIKIEVEEVDGSIGGSHEKAQMVKVRAVYLNESGKVISGSYENQFMIRQRHTPSQVARNLWAIADELDIISK